jgi:hypothetical protein
MKKFLHHILNKIKKVNISVIILLLFLIDGRQALYADALSVVVQKKYLVEKASMVIYMLDESKNQCVGTCQLHEAFEQRNISKQDLFIQKDSAMIQLTPDDIEINDLSQIRENDVVLHIEFDNDIRVLQVLIIKDTLSEDNPFHIISIPVGDCTMADDFDVFSDLIDGIDSETLKSNNSSQQTSLITQYMLYAKIYCMMQYKIAQNKLQQVTSWLCNKN